SFGGGSFLTRRQSTGEAQSQTILRLPSYPPSTPDHECVSFCAPEGTYRLAHQIFFRSVAPLYTVGTTASLVCIKYKETTNNHLHRYEPQPGALSFRRMFTNHGMTTMADSDDETIFRTPSISSSTSSRKTSV
ncbi:uncharacterized protein BYT42DRAFT_486228, partial [Radiomyces spectabilis]|uniref:uncharacterized protein n=1 Tax=Radiomyces spectabilis TaxID=64574 RepID=UPI00221EF3F1